MFIDTSAIYARLDADDQYHHQAVQVWADALRDNEPLVTTNYVVLETVSLLQRRLGMAALRAFVADALAVLDVEWVTMETHRAAFAALLAANRRALSLVDCVSFEVMRQLGLTVAFTFDADFAAYGFDCQPRST